LFKVIRPLRQAERSGGQTATPPQKNAVTRFHFPGYR
jgi:hypothetical protein